MEMRKADVKLFIKNHKEMDIWSSECFTHLADMVKFEKHNGKINLMKKK
ncbi:MAG: hypothetical protein LLG13_05690 [Bacteroidales bacterium]|nr:hypothetical protein [Bacteroidales bacterium]